METFERIVAACFEKGFSDLHVAGGHPLVCRKNGQLHFQKDLVFPPSYVDNLTERLLSRRQKDRLRRRWSVDLALTVGGNRLRVNVFSTQRGLSLAIRFLPGLIPDIESLNLDPALADYAKRENGLLLVCGPTGSGKTTTIAAIVDEINRVRACHVVTLEDPIEFLFTSREAFIEQRELGRHYHSYRDGLLDVLREAPDVIVVGEMRHPETIRLALDATESGHFVITTLHAGSPEEAIYRVCNSFAHESQDFVRNQLSSCLAGVLIQKLTYMPTAGFSVPHLCHMGNSRAVANIIRENKLGQIESVMETSHDKGMYTFTRYREEILPARKQFTPPQAHFTKKAPVRFPTEHLSTLIDYESVLPEHKLPFEDAPDANGHAASAMSETVSSAPAAPGDFASEVEAYIVRLTGQEAAP